MTPYEEQEWIDRVRAIVAEQLHLMPTAHATVECVDFLLGRAVKVVAHVAGLEAMVIVLPRDNEQETDALVHGAVRLLLTQTPKNLIGTQN